MTDSIATVAARLGLTVSAVFVPFSRSRNAKPGAKIADRSLNWTVTVEHNGRTVLTTDYQAGIGHCPYVKRHNVNFARMSVEAADAVEYETENGRPFYGLGAKPRIMPETADVLASLAMDSSAIDYPRFEDWADDCGYSPDSRKAEAIYRACLESALALRSALGDAALAELRDAAAEH